MCLFTLTISYLHSPWQKSDRLLCIWIVLVSRSDQCASSLSGFKEATQSRWPACPSCQLLWPIADRRWGRRVATQLKLSFRLRSKYGSNPQAPTSTMPKQPQFSSTSSKPPTEERTCAIAIETQIFRAVRSQITSMKLLEHEAQRDCGDMQVEQLFSSFKRMVN